MRNTHHLLGDRRTEPMMGRQKEKEGRRLAAGMKQLYLLIECLYFWARTTKKFIRFLKSQKRGNDKCWNKTMNNWAKWIDFLKGPTIHKEIKEAFSKVEIPKCYTLFLQVRCSCNHFSFLLLHIFQIYYILPVVWWPDLYTISLIWPHHRFLLGHY